MKVEYEHSSLRLHSYYNSEGWEVYNPQLTTLRKQDKRAVGSFQVASCDIQSIRQYAAELERKLDTQLD